MTQESKNLQWVKFIILKQICKCNSKCCYVKNKTRDNGKNWKITLNLETESNNKKVVCRSENHHWNRKKYLWSYLEWLPFRRSDSGWFQWHNLKHGGERGSTVEVAASKFPEQSEEIVEDGRYSLQQIPTFDTIQV
jgi:hypothetical protein